LTHSVVVDDLGDNGNVTSGRSVVNKDDSADFDESLEGGWLLGLDVSCVYGHVDRGRAAGPSPLFPFFLSRFPQPFVNSSSWYSSSYCSMSSLYHPSLFTMLLVIFQSIPYPFPFPFFIPYVHPSIQLLYHSTVLLLMLDLQPLLLSNYPINGEE